VGVEAQQDATFSASANLVIVDANCGISRQGDPDVKKSDSRFSKDASPRPSPYLNSSGSKATRCCRLCCQQAVPNTPAAAAAPAARKPATPGPTTTSAAAPIIRYQDRRLVAMLFDYSTMGFRNRTACRRTRSSLSRTDEAERRRLHSLCGHGAGENRAGFTTDKDRLKK